MVSVSIAEASIALTPMASAFFRHPAWRKKADPRNGHEKPMIDET
jgi:hypothetical protein